MSDVLTSAIAAVRAAGHDECHELAMATRSRVRRSLEVRARGRHRLVRLGAVMAVLFISTVSWALTSGRLSVFLRSTPTPAPSVTEPAPTDAPVTPRPRVPQPRPLAAVPEVSWPTPPIETPAPELVPPPPPAPRAPVRPRPAPTEVLYRKAHELHFHGGDHVAALAAWDAYLAAEPAGRFADEARYNRALVLVRLGRYRAAREALEPFARGGGGSADYRKHEAIEVIEQLDRQIEVNDPPAAGN